MCLILFAWKSHPEYPLIVAANRDEFYDRPTKSANHWEDNPEILAGKDLKAGGTWLGVTRQGKFAAITNYRDPQNIKENAISRGKLTLDYLKSDLPPEDYLSDIHPRAQDYNGFNLLVGDTDELYYYSNMKREIIPLSPGVFGLSNHLLNTAWPKISEGRQRFSEMISKDDIDGEKLLNLLDNRNTFPDSQLPGTGVPLAWERSLSAMHIDTEKYGTVSSTVVLMNEDECVFIEKTFNKPDEDPQLNRFDFRLRDVEVGR